MVVKKNRCYCFRVGYRRLSAVTDRESYPISKMNRCFGFWGEAQFSSPRNPNSEYRLIVMDEKNVDTRAFVMHHAMLKYSAMLFGSKKVSVMFSVQ